MYEELSDLDTSEYLADALRHAGARTLAARVLAGRHAHHHRRRRQHAVSNLLVPGIALASVPEGFLGESLFTSRPSIVEFIGSHSALGSDSDFLRLHVQSERDFDFVAKWHLLLRGELGTSTGATTSMTCPASTASSPAAIAACAASPTTACRRKNRCTSPMARRRCRRPAAGTCWSAASRWCATCRSEPGRGGVLRRRQRLQQVRRPLEYSAGVGLRYRLPVVSMGLDIAQPLSEQQRSPACT